MLACVSFVEIKEYLRELSCGWTDRQTDRQTEVSNTFQLSLESVKKYADETESYKLDQNLCEQHDLSFLFFLKRKAIHSSDRRAMAEW